MKYIQECVLVKDVEKPTLISWEDLLDKLCARFLNNQGPLLLYLVYFQVWEWIAKTNGVMTSKDYPYLAADGAVCAYNRNKPLAKVFGSARLPDNKALKQALLTYGPVSVGVHASLASFRNYKSGEFLCIAESKF